MDKLLLVYKKSAFEFYNNLKDEVISRFIQSSDIDAVAFKESRTRQDRSIEQIVDELDRSRLRYDLIAIEELRPIEGYDLVITAGGDGTFLATSHYVKGIPILGVNSDSQTSKGFFCCSEPYNFRSFLDNQSNVQQTRLNRLEIKINGIVIPELALNDVLIANSNQGNTTRYRFDINGANEKNQNSGLLICTSAGSSARMYNEGGSLMPISSYEMQCLAMGTRKAKPCFRDSLTLKSLTREGMIYIDGGNLIYKFTLGDIIDIKKGLPLAIIGDLEPKRTAQIEMLK